MKVVTRLFLTLLPLTFSFALASDDIETKDQSPPAEEAKLKFLNIPIEEKVGQLFLIGFKGTQFDSALKERIEKIKPGGLIFFKRNIFNNSRASKMISEIQKYNRSKKRTPVFTAIDQEGGVVTRVRTNPPMPSALAMGRTSDPRLVRSIGVATGKKLKAIGFNLNLAPVLDLSDPAKFSFIGNRSFGKDPSLAAAAAIQFSKGVESTGVLSTAKHFPGHGNVDTDSHVELPVSKLNKEELMESSTFPYKKAIDENAISAVMMAHMSFPNVDEAYPATYSKKIIDILKIDLGFNGILLTDDIQMSGASIYSSISERAVQAFLAGNDMIMVAWSFPDQLEAYNGLLEAVKTGRISEARIDESYEKIYKLKEAFKILNEPGSSDLSRVIAEQKDPTLGADVEAMLRDLAGQEQRKLDGSAFENFKKYPFVVISSDDIFLNEFRKVGIGKKTILVKLRKNISFKNLEVLEQRKSPFAGIIHVSGPVTSKIVNKMPMAVRDHFILVNNYFPGAISGFEAFHTVIDIPIRSASMGRSIANIIKNTPKKISPEEDLAEMVEVTETK